MGAALGTHLGVDQGQETKSEAHLVPSLPHPRPHPHPPPLLSPSTLNFKTGENRATARIYELTFCLPILETHPEACPLSGQGLPTLEEVVQRNGSSGREIGKRAGNCAHLPEPSSALAPPSAWPRESWGAGHGWGEWQPHAHSGSGSPRSTSPPLRSIQPGPAQGSLLPAPSAGVIWSCQVCLPVQVCSLDNR